MTERTPAQIVADLRAPFPPEQIGKLPKGGTSLDYVGHADVTDRLLRVDPTWNWEPLAIGPDGLPVFDAAGGLWIRLTVGGVSRLGYGDADGKRGNQATKIAIGDALRNAAMRFGVALDLWARGDRQFGPDQGEAPAPARPRQDAQAPQDGPSGPPPLPAHLGPLRKALDELTPDQQAWVRENWGDRPPLARLTVAQAANTLEWMAANSKLEPAGR